MEKLQTKEIFGSIPYKYDNLEVLSKQQRAYKCENVLKNTYDKLREIYK